MSDDFRLDSYFRCLNHPYRRFIVRRLRDVDDSIKVAELADEIASRSIEGPQDDGVRDRALIKLYHNHIPALSDAGVIEFDPESGQVSPTEVTTHLAAIVEIGRSIAEADGGGEPD